MRGRDHGETFDPRIPRPGRSGRLTSNADRPQARRRAGCPAIRCTPRCGPGAASVIWSRGAVVMSSKFLATKILHLMTIPPLPSCGAFQEVGARRFRHETEEPPSFLKSHPMPRSTHKSAYMTCSASVNLVTSCTYLPPTDCF